MPEHLSSLDVWGEINLIRQLSDVHLEPLLHLIEGLRVRLIADKGDGQTLGAKPREWKVLSILSDFQFTIVRENNVLPQFDGWWAKSNHYIIH